MTEPFSRDGAAIVEELRRQAEVLENILELIDGIYRSVDQ